MGLFPVEIEVLPTDGGTPQIQSVLVDTGASYLSLPQSMLISLGYRTIDKQRVVFATGQTAVWDVAEVRIRLLDRERTVLAFLAPDQAPKLLGAQTLETFGLGVDPLGKRLIPVDAHPAMVVALRQSHEMLSEKSAVGLTVLAIEVGNPAHPQVTEREGER